MAESDVVVSITGQDQGTTAMLNDATARLSALEQAFIKASASSDTLSSSTAKLGATHKLTGDAAALHAGDTNKLAVSMEQAQRAAAGLATSEELLGISSAGSAQHIRLMNVAIKELASASGPLIIAFIAIEAAFKAFSFFKEGVAEAEAMQASMNSLGSAVEEQGGKWEAASGSVEKWLAIESLATGYLQSELLPALNSLVTAGHDVHDSEIMASVGAEIARSKHVDLEAGVNAVAGAFIGLNRGVLRYDEGLRKLIKSGADQQQILDYLHEKYKRAINDHDDAAVAAARQHAAYSAMAEQIGKSMLPAMQYLSEAFIGGMQAAKDFVGAIGAGIKGAVMVVVDGANAMIHALGAVEDLLHGDRGAAARDFGQAVGLAGKAAGDAFAWVMPTIHSLNDLFHMHQIGHTAINNAIYSSENQAYKLDHDGPGKHPKQKHPKNHAGGGSSGFTPSSVPDAMMGDGMTASSEQQQQQMQYADKIAELKNKHAVAEEALAHAMKMTTDAASYNTAQIKLNALQVKDDQENTELLTRAVASDRHEITQHTKGITNSKDAYEQARTALNSYSASLSGHKKLSIEQKEHLKELHAAVTELIKAHNDARTALSHANTELDRHTKLLEADRLATQKRIDAEKELIPTLEREFSIYVDKQRIKEAELTATAHMNDEQKVAYYRQMMNSINVIDKASLQEKEGYYAQMVAEEKTAYDHMRANAAKYASETIKFFEQMGKSGKGIFQDLESAFKTMIDNMIRKFIESKLTDLFMKLLGGGGSAGGGLLGALGLMGASGGPLSFVRPGDVGSGMGITGADLIATGGGKAMAVHLAGAESGLLHGLGLTTSTGALSVLGIAGIVAAAAVGLGVIKIGGPKMDLTHNPDQLTGNSFAQGVANAQGSAYTQATGWVQAQGPTQLSQIDAFVKAHPGGAGLTGQELATWQQANALTGGGVAISEHGLNNGNVGLYDSMTGTNAIAGSTMNWQDLAKKLGDLTTAIGSNTSALTATFTITRSYPDFNASNIAGNNPKPGVGLLPGIQQAPAVTVNVNGPVVGPGGIDGVVEAISQGLARRNRGQAFGSSGVSRNFGS